MQQMQDSAHWSSASSPEDRSPVKVDDDDLEGIVRGRSITSPRVDALQTGKASLIRCDTMFVQALFLLTFFQADVATWSFSTHQVFTET